MSEKEKEHMEQVDAPELSDEQLENAAGGFEAWPSKWEVPQINSVETTTRVLEKSDAVKLLTEDGVPDIKRTL